MGLAKWFATVASERAASDAVQIHGANGYSDEFPVGRYYRNCKGAVIYEGTREIHTLMQADYALGLRADRPALLGLDWDSRLGQGEGIEPSIYKPLTQYLFLVSIVCISSSTT